MKAADFKLLMWAIVFLFLDIVLLVIYTAVFQKETHASAQNVDIIMISRGRTRAALQHQLWSKRWTSLTQTSFYLLYLNNSMQENTASNIIHIHTPYTTEQDIFINIAQVIPVENRSPRFLWISDQIIPLQNTSLDIFERLQGCDRFFSGFFPDYRLFNIESLLEFTIPCGLLRYSKMFFSDYNEFLIDFISGRHKTFAFIAEIFILPNHANKPKRPLSSDIFQVAHISPSSLNTTTLNEQLKAIWESYLLT